MNRFRKVKRWHAAVAAAAAAVVLVGILSTNDPARTGRAPPGRGATFLAPPPLAPQSDEERDAVPAPVPGPLVTTAVVPVPAPPTAEPRDPTEGLSGADREVMERHLRRFGPGDQRGASHWSDAAVNRVGVEKGTALAKDGDAGRRRLEQLELARKREALGLIDQVAAGLAWLVLHQGPDGVFQDDVALARCTELGHEPACVLDKGPKGPWSYPPAGTALSVMALLEFRDQDERGLFKPYLARGVSYLRRKQGEDGRFPGVANTDAALSLIALGRAAAATNDDGLKDAVRRGLACLAAQAAPDGGYVYDRRPGGDLRESAWVAQAIEAAEEAAVEVPDGMPEGLSRFLVSVWLGEHRFSLGPGGVAMPQLAPTGMLTGLLVWDDGRLAGVRDDWRRWFRRSGPAGPLALYYGARVAGRIDAGLTGGWRDALVRLAGAQEQSSAPGAGAWLHFGPTPLSEGGYAGVGVVHVTALTVLTLEHAMWGR